MQGRISDLVIDRGFGFISGEDGREFFFHRSALQAVEFEELAIGTPVVFQVSDDEPGDEPGEHPRAVSIRLSEDALPAADHEQLPPEKTR